MEIVIVISNFSTKFSRTTSNLNSRGIARIAKSYAT